jgi:hypothetical protein
LFYCLIFHHCRRSLFYHDCTQSKKQNLAFRFAVTKAARVAKKNENRVTESHVHDAFDDDDPTLTLFINDLDPHSTTRTRLRSYFCKQFGEENILQTILINSKKRAGQVEWECFGFITIPRDLAFGIGLNDDFDQVRFRVNDNKTWTAQLSKLQDCLLHESSYLRSATRCGECGYRLKFCNCKQV